MGSPEVTNTPLLKKLGAHYVEDLSKDEALRDAMVSTPATEVAKRFTSANAPDPRGRA